MSKIIQHQLFFPNPPAVVWEYLTNAELISPWLMKSNFLPIVGHEFQFRIDPKPKVDFDGVFYCRILEIIPYKKLSYSWKFGPGNGKLHDSAVHWTLIEKDNGTELQLEHTAFEGADASPLFAYMNEGWLNNIRKMQQLANAAKDFTTVIVVDQSPKEVFDAVTNPRGWWSEEIEGGTAKLNDEFLYHMKDMHITKMKLTEVVPDKKVVWLVRDNYFSFTTDKNEWKGTKIIFDIAGRNGKTEMRFTHQGLTPAYECYNICFDAWTGYIQNSLHSLITTGKGQPNPLEHFTSPLLEQWKTKV